MLLKGVFSWCLGHRWKVLSLLFILFVLGGSMWSLTERRSVVRLAARSEPDPSQPAARPPWRTDVPGAAPPKPQVDAVRPSEAVRPSLELPSPPPSSGAADLGVGTKPRFPRDLTDPLPAEAGVLLNKLVPLPPQTQVSIDCDQDGGPEDIVRLSGSVHTVVTQTTNGQVTITAVPRDVTGTGLLTGDTYRVGNTSTSGIVSDTSSEVTLVNTVFIIAQGSGFKYKVQNLLHVTINPQGDVTAAVDDSSITCPGPGA